MAVWRSDWNRTQQSIELDNKVENALKPVFDWCVENQICFEDFFYSTCMGAQDLILLAVLDRKKEYMKHYGKENP